MKYNDRQYPHPVLGIQDDIESNFTYTLRVSSNGEFIRLNPNFNIENESLLGLISHNKAEIILHLYCSSTIFREAHVIKDLISSEIKINAEKLKGKVEVDALICACVELPDYFNKDWNKDYGKNRFYIEKGDILGYGGTGIFYANKSPEELKSVASIMNIRSDNKKTGSFRLEYGEEKITIFLPQNDFENYRELTSIKGNFIHLIHGTLVFPALVQVINFMLFDKDRSIDYQDTSWYELINKRIEEARSEDPLEITQKILELPVNRSFIGMKEMFDEGFN
jgi:hypothetical protein